MLKTSFPLMSCSTRYFNEKVKCCSPVEHSHYYCACKDNHRAIFMSKICFTISLVKRLSARRFARHGYCFYIFSMESFKRSNKYESKQSNAGATRPCSQQTTHPSLQLIQYSHSSQFSITIKLSDSPCGLYANVTLTKSSFPVLPIPMTSKPSNPP